MYKNFNLTESEKEQILNMHKDHGYKKPLNEQSFEDYQARKYSDEEMDAMTKTQMDHDDEKFRSETMGYGDENETDGSGYDLSVTMAIMSHLSDLQEVSKGSRDRINFIKVLVKKYIPKDIEVNTDKLDALYDQVSNGDFSGSALDDIK